VSVTFSIKCPVNTANKRLHWAVKHNLFREVRHSVWAALAAIKALPTSREKLILAKEPVKKMVSFVRYWGGRSREMDHDGFACATKPVLDALKLGDKGEGLIYDDAPSWVAVTWEQIKCKEKAGTLEVTIQ